MTRTVIITGEVIEPGIVECDQTGKRFIGCPNSVVGDQIELRVPLSDVCAAIGDIAWDDDGGPVQYLDNLL